MKLMCNEVDNNFVFFITHQLISTYNISDY